MILTVTLNIALDRTVAVPRVALGNRHRVVDSRRAAGGKGVNIARALKSLGEPVIATGFAAGPTGARIRELLDAEQVLHDFVEVAQQHTMGAPGTGAADLDLAAHPPRPWPLPGTPHAQWFAGTWERTPASQTATLQLTDHAWVHLSREGRAVLVHRLCTDADVHLPDALHALRDRFRPHTPVLLYGCDPVSCISAACLTAGWAVIQHAHVMERRFW